MEEIAENITNIAEPSAEAEAVTPIKNDAASADTDVPCEIASKNGDTDEMTTLTEEIARLKKYIESKEAETSRGMKELEEFKRLYPDEEPEDIPDCVWERVEAGLPLSAAYALYCREQALLSALAKETNERNAALSAGGLMPLNENEYFSPEEVKRMTRREVRENYASIRRSMNFWRNASK